MICARGAYKSLCSQIVAARMSKKPTWAVRATLKVMAEQALRKKWEAAMNVANQLNIKLITGSFLALQLMRMGLPAFICLGVDFFRWLL